jgi:hypothetical protein
MTYLLVLDQHMQLMNSKTVILNFVLVRNSCAKIEIIAVSVSLLRAIKLYCLRTGISNCGMLFQAYRNWGF